MASRRARTSAARGMQRSAPEVEKRLRELFPSCNFCVIRIPAPAGAPGEVAVLCYAARQGCSVSPAEISRRLAGRIDRALIPHVVFRVRAAGAGLDRERVRAQLLRTVSRAAVRKEGTA